MPADWCPWVAGRTVYQLHALGAAGVAPRNPDVDAAVPVDRGLRRLDGWLDHVARLGCGAVLLTPIFVSSTHGYDTVDPWRIDQRLGDDDDFAAFVAACRGRDLNLILDGVFNHVGRDFAPFRDVVARGEASEWKDWFRLDFSRSDGDGDGFGYATFEGHRELVALNHDNPAVLAWAIDVACHWLERGADGWRLDVAYAIPPPFLRAFTAAVREARPDAFVFGEMIHGDYARFVTESALDSVTQYELYKAIWSALNDANLFELAWALTRHRSLLETFAPVTFAGNHDVTRLASQLRNPGHLGPALAVLYTVPGVPCVYYGDEFAWRGLKEDRAGGDDAIRPALPASPAPVDDEQAATLRLHEELIAFRRARSWLTDADIDTVEVANRRLTYRVWLGPDALLVIVHEDLADPIDVPSGWRAVVEHPGFTVAEPIRA